MKRCDVCREERPSDEFHKDRTRKDGLSRKCKPCASEYKKWNQLERQYALSREDFYKLKEEQGSRCAICLQTLGEYTAVVDHSHETGVIRGLLCHACNTGIGFLGDGRDTEIFNRASRYLKNTSHERTDTEG